MDGIDKKGATVDGRTPDVATPETVRQRIALGVLAAPALVDQAITRLTGAGVSADDVAIVAEAGNVDDSFVHGITDRSDPHPRVFLHGPDGDGAASPAPSDNAAGSKSDASLFGGRLVDFDSWLTPALALNLKRHLQHGAIILAVLMTTPSAERAVSEILLQTSIDRVQLHDIA